MECSWKNISFYSKNFLHETLTLTNTLLQILISYFLQYKVFHLPWNVTMWKLIFHMFLLNVRSHLLSYAVSHYEIRIRRFSLWSFSILTLKDYPGRTTWNLQILLSSSKFCLYLIVSESTSWTWMAFVLQNCQSLKSIHSYLTLWDFQLCLTLLFLN